MKAFLLALVAFLAFPPPLVSAAPVNLAPNSQWEIASALPGGAKWNIEGTGTLNPVSVTGNTTGSTTVVFAVSGASGELKVGDLVTTAHVNGIDPCLIIAPMRVSAIVANASVTVVAPHGCVPFASTATTLSPYNIGGNLSNNTGDAFDGWKKSSSMLVWREDNAANVAPGAYYAMALHKDVAGQEFAALEYPNGGHSDAYNSVTAFQGKTVAFGACVYQKVRGGAGTWQVSLTSDGTGALNVSSPAAPASSAGVCNWAEISGTIRRP